MLEVRLIGFVVRPSLMKVVQKTALKHLRRQVADPALRRALTPDYTIGCKRILLSNDYYPALSRANVKLETNRIMRVEADCVVTRDNVRHPVDCIIFGTGFTPAEAFARGTIIGRDGVDIADAWRDGAHAYLGTTLNGYPNFFMIVGPNTGLGHNSMVYMIEAQADYIVQAIKHLRDNQLASIDVKQDIEADYNQRIQARLERAIWSTGGCKSWYLDPRTGKNATLWPDFSWRFRRAVSVFKTNDYLERQAMHSFDAPPEQRSAS
jgi:cation diffusion facilitator CzcD-associated flavoprotein CzcO